MAMKLLNNAMHVSPCCCTASVYSANVCFISDLSCQPNHEEVKCLTEHVSHRWKEVARCLLPQPLPERILANIEQQHGRLSDRFIVVLEEWNVGRVETEAWT